MIALHSLKSSRYYKAKFYSSQNSFFENVLSNNADTFIQCNIFNSLWASGQRVLFCSECWWWNQRCTSSWSSGCCSASPQVVPTGQCSSDIFSPSSWSLECSPQCHLPLLHLVVGWRWTKTYSGNVTQTICQTMINLFWLYSRIRIEYVMMEDRSFTFS